MTACTWAGKDSTSLCKTCWLMLSQLDWQCSTKCLVMSHNAFQFLTLTPIKIQWVCGIVLFPFHTPLCYCSTSLTWINQKILIFFQSSAVKLWYFLVHLNPLAVFPSWELVKNLLLFLWETTSQPSFYSSNSTADSNLALFILQLLYIWVAFQFLRELSLMCCSSEGVVTFCLPGCALDKSDPVSVKHFRAPLETSSLADTQKAPLFSEQQFVF